MTDDGKVNILIVDDRPEQRLALATVLAELGENVVEAASGREAFRQLLRYDFAVVLLDVNMPAMDGFETAALIRQRKQSEHTPIIFVTAFSDELRTARGYSLGAVDYILSPVDPDVLKTKVSVFVDLHRKAREVKRQAASLEHRAAQLRRLAEASLAIHSAPSIERVLEIVTETAAEIAGAHRASAAFVPPLNGTPPKTVSWSSDRRADDPELTEPPAPVFADRGPMRVDAGRSAGGGLLAAPFNGRDGRDIGWVQIWDRESGDFTDDDEAMVVQVAQMASIAIENTLYVEAHEANRLKDEFLGTLSHELRTPLQTMLTWVRMLRSDKADAELLKRGLEVIERSAKGQAKLIDDILDVSRIITGKLNLEPRALDLVAIVTAAVDAIAPIAAAKGVEIRRSIDASPCSISGDAGRFQQILGNLLSNAVKFTAEGGWVEVRLEQTRSEARITVSDNGKGISPEFLPCIFERFRQADSSTTRRHGGLGLGLAIAKHLVDLHRGTLRADSDGEGKGATFTLTFPLLPKRRRTAVPIVAPAVERRASSTGVLENLRLDGLRVLVVDDEADTRESLALALGQRGAVVVPAGSVADAIAMIDLKVPDVLLSDLGMPGADGYALIREVRSREPLRGGRVPAVALTAYVRPEDRLRALLAGFDAQVDKPVGPAELVAVVKEVAERVKRA